VPVERGDPIGESTQAGSGVDVGAADAVVGNHDVQALTVAVDRDCSAGCGDSPPPGGGPGPPTNTYSYLKAHVSGAAAAGLPDAVFRSLFAANVGVLPDGSLNLERVQLTPLFQADDDFLEHLLHADVDLTTGLLADPTPPYALYCANLNHVGPLGNPLASVS
jgi:hypothetical protein